MFKSIAKSWARLWEDQPDCSKEQSDCSKEQSCKKVKAGLLKKGIPLDPRTPQEHIDAVLGFPVRDKVTGFEGVCTGIHFDLFGCIQAVVNPPVDDKNSAEQGKWYDVSRLELTSTVPTMEPHLFHEEVTTADVAEAVTQGAKGGAAKSLPSSNY